VQRSIEHINFQARFNYSLGAERITPLQNLLLRIVFRNLGQDETNRLVPFIKVLLDHGADPYLKDGWEGRSAIMIAVADLRRMKGILEVLVPEKTVRKRWESQSYWVQQGCGIGKDDVLRPIIQEAASQL
jgi:hypothetical protein